MQNSSFFKQRSLSSLLFCVLLLISAAQSSHAEDVSPPPFELQNTQVHTLYSDNGDQHELIIRLPESYGSAEFADKTYPVLYVLDGYWDFSLVDNLYGNLTYDQQLTELIVVGLSYPSTDSAIFSDRRGYDLTPTSLDFLPEGILGGGPEYLSYIQNKVVPFIENNFRADNNDRGLIGTSYAGLFSLWSLYQDPDFFKRHIAISPSVEFDNGILFDIDDDFATSNNKLNTRLFIAWGGKEHPILKSAIHDFVHQVLRQRYKGLHFRAKEISGAGHAGVKNFAYPKAIRSIYSDLKPNEPNPQDAEVELMKAFGLLDRFLDPKPTHKHLHKNRR